LAAIAGRAKKNEPTNQDLQGALIALDVGTGGIRAMVGGRDFLRSPFNRATEAVRQPGSAFKPFVYACAVENGYAQNHLILDAPVVFKGARAGDDWRPENYSRNYDGEITLRRALVNSKNIPAVRLTKMVGPDAVAKFSRACGISTPLTENLTLALGTSGVTLLDLTAAYAVFPNRGEWTKPWSIAEIRDSNGRMIRQAKAPKRVVMSRSGAAILTDMLVGVIHEGTGGRASALKWPLAGKTGTTDGYRDALFVGFSPSIVCGVWVGRDRPESLGAGESGARAALPIWVDYMREVLPSQPVDYFDIPDDVVRIRIDPVSGRRVAGGGQAAVFAMFQKGTEP
jgi:penicillin-binding protein 1A